MEQAVFTVAVVILACAAYGDLRRRRISNVLVLALAGLGLLRIAFADDAGAALWTLAAGGSVLAAGFILFASGIIGGGDAKLLAAATLLVGARDLPLFLLVMSLCGGLVALAVVIDGKLRPWLGAFALWALAQDRLAAWCARRPRLKKLLSATAERAGEGTTLARLSVPYGVAIAAAGIFVLSFQFSFLG